MVVILGIADDVPLLGNEAGNASHVRETKQPIEGHVRVYVIVFVEMFCFDVLCFVLV